MVAKTQLSKKRRMFVGSILTAIFAVVFVVGGAVVGSLVTYGHDHPQTTAAAPPATFNVIHRPPAVYETAKQVPVLVYHEMNNGCKATAATCINPKDAETVSTTQFTSEMNYLVKNGYHTVSLAQYETWLANGNTKLPAKPILLTADNGIDNFLAGAQPILGHDGFVATANLVSGFTDGVSGKCEPDVTVAGVKYNVQPGCPRINVDWDATWSQLRNLNPKVYNFALEAGPSGHYPQTYDAKTDPKCVNYDVCLMPGETMAHYETRVEADNSTGIKEIQTQLSGRVINTEAWTVPFSNLGYPQCKQSDCTPQVSTSNGWLIGFAARHYKVAFVQDAYRNGTRNERFRYDINGKLTQAQFQAALASFTASNSFAR